MRGRSKVLLGAAGVVLGAPAAVAGWFFLAFPKMSAPRDLRIEATDELRARGAYLAVHVAACVDCHAERDWSRFSAPRVPGTEGKGGEKFGRESGFPGEIHASNITPAGVGSYTDGELARAITEGVTKDGRAMFPIMPYPAYAKMCERDTAALIVHVRGLAPIDGAPPRTELDFPLSLVVRTIPEPVASAPACPDPADERAVGEYLTGIAACGACHTKSTRGKPVPGMRFAGGMEFKLPGGGVARSANLTPHAETGLGRWDDQMFVQRFKALASRPPPKVAPGGFNTPMPWTAYAGMTDADLRAVFAYLQTLEPVDNPVERFSP